MKNDKKKVRNFSDSVYRPGEFVFAFVMMYLLGIFFDALLIIYVEEYSWEVWAMLGVSFFATLFRSLHSYLPNVLTHQNSGVRLQRYAIKTDI